VARFEECSRHRLGVQSFDLLRSRKKELLQSTPDQRRNLADKNSQPHLHINRNGLRK
jgi:hypothetical protein